MPANVGAFQTHLYTKYSQKVQQNSQNLIQGFPSQPSLMQGPLVLRLSALLICSAVCYEAGIAEQRLVTANVHLNVHFFGMDVGRRLFW